MRVAGLVPTRAQFDCNAAAELDVLVIRHATYIPAMPDGTLERSYGEVFDQVAEDYDLHRPKYPEALLDHAREIAAVGAGERVLEIGCGTGQLTRYLLARGLRVSAIEPGDRLIALARQNTADIGDAGLRRSRRSSREAGRAIGGSTRFSRACASDAGTSQMCGRGLAAATLRASMQLSYSMTRRRRRAEADRAHA